MDKSEPKKYGTAAEIEMLLISRMEERFRDGDVAEEISDYFELQGQESEIPLFLIGKQRRERTKRSGGDRVARRDVAAGSTCPPTNRTPTFHENAETPENTECPRIMGGYDGGVEVGFHGYWEVVEKTETFRTLETAKESAMDDDDPQPHFELCGHMMSMSSKSARVGRCHYKYVFESNGVKFYVHSNPKGHQQGVRIRYDATGLIGRDLFHKHWETMCLLFDMGFIVTKEMLSRVDMQVMIYCTLSDLLGPDDECRKKIVCTAQNYQINGKGLGHAPQTFTMGNHAVIQICIYDKRAEMFRLMTKDPVKYNLMIQNCFGDDWQYDEVPTLRVEFRIGRNLLRSMGIDTMEDLLECESGLARYCCHSWFRITAKNKKRGHSHEQETSARWKEVQAAFAKWFPGVDGHRRDVKRNYDTEIKCDADHLIKQAVGCMATACALECGAVEAPHESMIYTLNKVRKYIGRLFERTVERAIELGIKVGDVIVDDYRSACDVRASLEKVGPKIFDPLNDPVPIMEF